MKRSLFIFVAALMLHSSKAQTTWTQPSGSSHIYNANTTGNVGIGLSTTTTPLQKLHVGGNIQADGNLIVMPSGAFYSDVNNIAFFTDGGYIFANRNNSSSRMNLSSAGVLSLFNNNTVKVSLNPAGSSYINGGNLGIGINTPTYALSVLGTAQFNAINDETKAYTRISWNAVAGTGASTFDNHRDLGNAAFVFRTTTGTNPFTEVMRINANGYMGIGTSTPSANLNIDPKGAGSILIGNSNTGTSGYTSLTLGISAQTNGYAHIQSIGSAGSSFGTLALNPGGGNVGIGTADTKGYMLAVAGSAIATKVVVKQQASWPDYVFEPAYQLPSLQSVENFITVNKHLPEVPSAEIIYKDGVDLGNNQVMLLKKIEELTLYLIEQNKKQEQLQNEVEALKKKLEITINNNQGN